MAFYNGTGNSVEEILGASSTRWLRMRSFVLGLFGEWAALDVVEVQPILSTGWRAMPERKDYN